MSFLDHLDELRTLVIRSCIAIAAGMLVAFVFIDRLTDFVLAPTLAVLPPHTELVFIRPGAGFSFDLDVALIGGVVLAAPFVMYQVWLFIAPGLHRHEKKLAVPFVVLVTIGTACGALFSHFVLFPGVMAFFSSFDAPHKIKFLPGLEEVFDQYMKMLIGMVIVFQMPTLALFLARLRMVTARWLWRNIKYAVLIIFVVAAILTSTPDAWNQAAFALPMMVLYLVSIGVAWLAEPKRPVREEDGSVSNGLKLVFAVSAIDYARRRQQT